MAAIRGQSWSLTGNGEPARVDGEAVSASEAGWGDIEGVPAGLAEAAAAPEVVVEADAAGDAEAEEKIDETIDPGEVVEVDEAPAAATVVSDGEEGDV